MVLVGRGPVSITGRRMDAHRRPLAHGTAGDLAGASGLVVVGEPHRDRRPLGEWSRVGWTPGAATPRLPLEGNHTGTHPIPSSYTVSDGTTTRHDTPRLRCDFGLGTTRLWRTGVPSVGATGLTTSRLGEGHSVPPTSVRSFGPRLVTPRVRSDSGSVRACERSSTTSTPRVRSDSADLRTGRRIRHTPCAK